jgi:hypothetical protein
MQIINTIYYRNQDFADYLKMPGLSYSGTKDEVITPTEGMSLGTRVHNYLNEPDKYDWKQPEMVLPIAKALRAFLGDAFHALEKEVAFTSDFIHNGMLLHYKGRADMIKIGRLLVDIKVLGSNIQNAIDRFGYDKQLSGYCLATTTPLGLIIAYNKLLKKVEVKAIKPDAAFWEYQCVQRGEPVEAVQYEG